MNLPRILLFASTFLSAALGLRAQTVGLHEDFESGAPGWSLYGFAHIEPDSTTCGALVAPFPSPGHCVWFGTSATCDYSGPPGTGLLAFPNPILLPSGPGRVVLRFARLRDAGPCSDGEDITNIQVSTAGGQYQLLWSYECGEEIGWAHRRIDLTAWAGTAVDIYIGFGSANIFHFNQLGYWIDDVELVREPGFVICTADGFCPCSNQVVGFGYQGQANSGGCIHSGGKEARLIGDGMQSVAADTVALTAQDLPPATTLIYVQGTTSQSIPFGDGKRCFGGTAMRLAVRGVLGGRDTYPHTGEPGVAMQGAVPAVGGTRTYQVVFRDAASYCTSSTFNTSNGYVITWLP